MPNFNLTKKEAIEFCNIPENHFKNFHQYSKELIGKKIKNRWYFDEHQLEEWRSRRDARTIQLSLDEYKKCFQFAMKMAYSGYGRHGSGIRGNRSEVQMADDFILGILAEVAVKKFLRNKFDLYVELDEEIHPGKITPQDIINIKKNGTLRPPKKTVSVKSSKVKSCYNIIDPTEYENDKRNSDIYIFCRVNLPTDHLFRVFRNNEFFKPVKKYLERQEKYKKIEPLQNIKVWICGYNHLSELKAVRKIPGQEFTGRRYVSCVSNMHNSDSDWKSLIRNL